MVFSNCVGKKIGDVSDGFFPTDVIAVVDGNGNDCNVTAVYEYPNDRGNNSCKEHNDRTDNAVDKLEA